MAAISVPAMTKTSLAMASAIASIATIAPAPNAIRPPMKSLVTVALDIVCSSLCAAIEAACSWR